MGREKSNATNKMKEIARAYARAEELHLSMAKVYKRTDAGEHTYKSVSPRTWRPVFYVMLRRYSKSSSRCVPAERSARYQVAGMGLFRQREYTRFNSPLRHDGRWGFSEALTPVPSISRFPLRIQVRIVCLDGIQRAAA